MCSGKSMTDVRNLHREVEKGFRSVHGETQPENRDVNPVRIRGETGENRPERRAEIPVCLSGRSSVL
ncbi:hypothetical protein PBY51_008415 [Eleginops maclovinus]|uniref:Uncharacterized protein n=1 Tax=Eleginops maclovinus TaxID=56733 RepID=A0AAN7X5V6_ELEMC|nr:hypothetical protein PBY51_008415 [Eleginops maclovinus]